MKKRYPRGRVFLRGRLKGIFTDVADYTGLPASAFRLSSPFGPF
jgi:hypothetical protein